MDKILDFQISLFGNFEDIKADNENVTILLQHFKGYNVGFIMVTSVDLRTSRLLYDKRIQLIAQNQDIIISFLPERIDVNYKWNPSIPKENDPSLIYDKLAPVISLLNTTFHSKLGNRVATSCNILSNKFSNETLKNFIERYSSRNNFFENEDLTSEWLLRFNSKKDLIINKTSEICNRLITMTIPQNPQFNNQILITVDINSAAENTTDRFSFGDLLVFSNNTKDIIITFLSKICEE